MNPDVFGEALNDYFIRRKNPEKLWLHNSYGEPEEMPVDWFFRGENSMPDIELYALDLCRGNILDIGAGVGAHSLALQKAGLEVMAIELSQQACTIMQKRGVKHMLCLDVFAFHGQTFETILMLMNGIGLCGDLQTFKGFLAHARTLLQPGGQILFDSSDISYLYEKEKKPHNHYFGEIEYRYEYNGRSGNWFSWLYIDQQKLMQILPGENWDGQVIYEDDNDHYLARIWPV